MVLPAIRHQRPSGSNDPQRQLLVAVHRHVGGYLRLARPFAGAKVTDHRVMSALEVARTAPAPLLHAAQQLSVGARGVIVQLAARRH